VTSGFTLPAGWTVKGTADFNNDGLTDAVVTNGPATQVWYLDAAGAVTGTVALWNTSSGWSLTGIGDFNSDGKKDFLYTRSSDGLKDAVILNNLTIVQEIVGGSFTPDPVQSLGGNEGTDTVQASISYALPTGVENLTLTGTGNINGTGNAYDNVIVGNAGSNVLTGMGGNDTITGGAGSDTFAFNFAADGVDTIVDFVHGTDFLQISASGFGGGLSAGGAVTVVNAASAGTASNAGTAGYFIFDNSGASAGTVYWDATGGSGADAVAFATLGNLASLLPSDFHVV
jgi:Ca2+-binding RTX toxin-like protein